MPVRGRVLGHIPIVQDSSALLNGLDISAYHDFSEDLIGSLKFHARAINGVDDDVRLTDRLYVPRKRLRGFNVFKVGPKDGSQYIGGNYGAAINFTSSFPNFFNEFEILSAT